MVAYIVGADSRPVKIIVRNQIASERAIVFMVPPSKNVTALTLDSDAFSNAVHQKVNM